MFGSDDDVDFFPGSKSKLSLIFSGAKSDNDNASFTFAAPKQPKKGILKDQISKSEEAIRQDVTLTADAAAGKLAIIIVRAVHVFLLIDGKYDPQGKMGAAVLGNSSRSTYQLLLYKGRQQHVTSTKITPEFVFTVQTDHYGNFYNDQGQNWSIHFEEVTDCEEFAREVVLARAASQRGGDKILSLLTQDISVPNESDSDNVTASEGDMVEIYYSVQTYAAGKLGKLVESNRDAKKPQKVKISRNVWEEGLIGTSRGVKRILMLPPDLVGPWKKEVPEGTSLVVEVETGRMKQLKPSHPSTPSHPCRASTPRLPSVADSGESAFESGADDSIRARGASISQALCSSPRTNKASLISRMARMGQPTLPLRGAISCNPSDSEETGDESSSRSAKGATFKPVKGRTAKARPTTAHQTVPVDAQPSVPPQQVMVYQSVPGPWQQQALMDSYNMGRTYQGADGRPYTAPLPTPIYPAPSMSDAVGTPTGPAASDLSVFLSETRTHNAEVRMAVAKVGDKVDQVLGKMDLIQNRSNVSVALMDSSSLLATIQKMITENEQLKLELEDKRNKVEVQNDQIYQLLNTKQQYMEQSSSASSQEAAIASLQSEKADLTAELAALKEKANGILLKHEQSQNSWAKQILELKEVINKLQVDLAGKNVSKIDTDQLKSLQERITEMQSAKKDAEKKLAAAENELVTVKNESQEKLANLIEKTSSKISLMESQSDLMKQFEMLRVKTSESSNESQIADKVRTVMNAVWKALHPQFISGSDYEGESIRKILMTIIRDVTNQHVNATTASSAKEVKVISAPAQLASTPSPPLKGAKNASPPPKDTKTTSAPATRVRSPPPPKNSTTSPPPSPQDAGITTASVKASIKGEVDSTPMEAEQPKAAERKLPGTDITTSQSEITAERNLTADSPVKKEEGPKKTDITTQRVVAVGESKSTPMVQTSPKPSPEQTPKSLTKQSPQPIRELDKPNEIESGNIISGDEKPAVVVKKPDVAKKEAEVPALKSEEVEGWRPEPPPLFDSEDDEDGWLA